MSMTTTEELATERQVRYILALVRKQSTSRRDPLAESMDAYAGMTKREASKLITKLTAPKPAPKRQPEAKPEPTTRTVGTCPDGCCGYIQDIATGQIIGGF